MPTKFVNVALNVHVDSLFTYTVPLYFDDDELVGKRILVPFGSRKLTALVVETINEPPKNLKTKTVLEILDHSPLITDELIQFCKWISRYYVCPVGEVLFSALPKGIHVEEKIAYYMNPETDLTALKLTPSQNDVVNVLHVQPFTFKQLSARIKNKSLRSVLSSLIGKNILLTENKIQRETSKPKYEKIVRFELIDELRDYPHESLDVLFKDYKLKSQKQKDILSYLLTKNIFEIRLADLLKETGSSSQAVTSLAQKNLLTLKQTEVYRNVKNDFSEAEKEFTLNPEQEIVLEKINSSLLKKEYKPFLLFGVTGSGKTQVYIEAIKTCLSENRSAIVLVPEISLTPQLIHRFTSVFGEIVGVIHSRLSDNQRYDVFRRVQSGEIKIIIGARSALFANINNLGIIVVDEEHDHSYKQSEKEPRYNARDSALVRAKLNNAVVVLGSATPSLESFYNARQKKYELLELPHRAMKTKQPHVEIVDMLNEMKSVSKFIKHETSDTRFLSSKLIAEIDNALNQKHSVILLQNRRGYSAYQECQNCGNVKMCVNCDITMIYHKAKDHLRCHFCGHIKELMTACEKCGSSDLKLKGTGTEKIEEEISRLFPKAKLKRMDADTVRGKDSHGKILKSFYDREFDILLGTQMISKGLDFPNVQVVGVVSADIGLLNPDFRSTERTFQLLMQVAGRAGRQGDFGKVIIQTTHTDNFIFPLIKEHDYVSFYEKEIGYRQQLSYPPFSRLAVIEARSDDAVRSQSIASKIFLQLKTLLNESLLYKNVELLKPAPSLIFKLKNKFRYHVILKIGKEKGQESFLQKVKTLLNEIKLKQDERIMIDVDPLSFN